VSPLWVQANSARFCSIPKPARFLESVSCTESEQTTLYVKSGGQLLPVTPEVNISCAVPVLRRAGGLKCEIYKFPQGENRAGRMKDVPG